MSLSKSKREKYHLDRKSKFDVLQAINEIGPKPGAKKWSSRELADLLGQKLGRKISHTTVATLMKKVRSYKNSKLTLTKKIISVAEAKSPVYRCPVYLYKNS